MKQPSSTFCSVQLLLAFSVCLVNLNEQQNARVSIKRRRFLYRASRKPSSVYVTIYLGSALPRGSSDYGERDGQPLNAPISILLRVGFTGTRRVSAPPVGSYPAFPSLPHNAAVYFCCTFLKVAFTGRYPAPLSCGARTFLTIIQWIARSLGLLDHFIILRKTCLRSCFRSQTLPGIDSQVRFPGLGLSQYRACRGAPALTRAAPFGRDRSADFPHTHSMDCAATWLTRSFPFFTRLCRGSSRSFRTRLSRCRKRISLSYSSAGSSRSRNSDCP